MTSWQITQLGLATAFAAILVGLSVLRPAGDHLRLPFATAPLPELCPSRRATGEPCPSCGLTRGMVAAIRLDADAARAWHPAAISLLALIVAQIIGRVTLAAWPLRGRRTLAIGAVDFSAHALGVSALLALW